MKDKRNIVSIDQFIGNALDGNWLELHSAIIANWERLLAQFPKRTRLQALIDDADYDIQKIEAAMKDDLKLMERDHPELADHYLAVAIAVQHGLGFIRLSKFVE